MRAGMLAKGFLVVVVMAVDIGGFSWPRIGSNVHNVEFLIETEVKPGCCTQIERKTTCAADARVCGGRVNVGGRIIFGGGRNGLVWSIWRAGRLAFGMEWGAFAGRARISHRGTEARRRRGRGE